ncbi:hypothetical protein ACIGXA_17360 [Streptomyces fildesensis]|uniref:DUF3558 domain-containing protein n=1 Tax=Streptomyces fildesensis TaxID=375757 RepID=A0ABW8C789_9ACTN
MRVSPAVRPIGALLACCLALVGCNGNVNQAKTPKASSAVTTPGPKQTGTADGLPNKNPRLFRTATPCKLVTSDDLRKLFKGTFSNILGTEDSPVTDEIEMTRACGYHSSDARIDHPSSYDITDLTLTITTTLDDKAGTLWRTCQEAMRTVGGQHAFMPEANDLIHLGPGWYQARKGQVIIEIHGITENDLTDEGARNILKVALNRLA